MTDRCFFNNLDIKCAIIKKEFYKNLNNSDEEVHMKELVAYFSSTGTTKKKVLELANLEKYDFSNKEVVLFATLGGSGWGETFEFVKTSVDKSCKINFGKVNSLEGI